METEYFFGLVEAFFFLASSFRRDSLNEHAPNAELISAARTAPESKGAGRGALSLP